MPPAKVIALVFLAMLLIVIPVYAHVPLRAEGNSNLSTALVIENPLKSYVIYSHLHRAGDTEYFSLPMHAGDRLTLSVNIPRLDSPVPDLVVMHPVLIGRTPVPLQFDGPPAQVEVPPMYNPVWVRGKPPARAEYEPFSPSAIYPVASYEDANTMTGTYYVAVTASADETDYSLAVGYVEEFTPVEWILVPVNVVGTILPWEGQSGLEIFAPFVAVLVIGYALVGRRVFGNKTRRSLAFWLAIAAGLLYIAGAALTLYQMVRVLGQTGFTPLAAITVAFIAIPVLLGIWALRIAYRSPFTVRDRVFLVVIGMLGLIVWAGIVVGPAAAIIAAVLPERSETPDQP